MKTYILTHFGPDWDQKGSEDLAHMGHFSHIPESTHNIGGMGKNAKIPISYLFFLQLKIH